MKRPSARRVNKTGRSAGLIQRRRPLSQRPPKGASFIWFTLEFLDSGILGRLGVNAYRVLLFLCREHCRHGGQENGDLAAPYIQLEAWGCSRTEIAAGIKELEAVGLIRVKRSSRQAGRQGMSRYSLTWLPTHDGPATNEWKGMTLQRLDRIGEEQQRANALKRARKAARKASPSLKTAQAPPLFHS